MPRSSWWMCAVLVGALAVAGATALERQDPPPNPRVVIETTAGDITVELFRQDARVSVVNFTHLRAGRVLHRDPVSSRHPGLHDPGRRLHGRPGSQDRGAPRRHPERGHQQPAEPPRHAGHGPHGRSELGAGPVLHQHRRQPQPRPQGPDRAGLRLRRFGRVVDGMDIVERIERTGTHSRNGLDDVPRNPIVIIQIRRLD